MKLYLVVLLGLLVVSSFERLNCDHQETQKADPLDDLDDELDAEEEHGPQEPPTLVPVEPLDAEEAAEEEADRAVNRHDILEDLTPSLNISPIGQVDMNEAKRPKDGQKTVGGFICGRYYSRVYRRINDFLVKEVPGGQAADPEISMQLTIERLHKEEKRPNIFNKCFLPALRQFTALAAPDECTWDRFRVIYMNDRATNGRTHKPINYITKLRHVESIIHKYSYQHAAKCHHTYPTIFNEVHANADKSVLLNVEMFTDAIIKNYKLSQHKFWIFDFKKWGKDIDMIKILRDIRHVHHNADGKRAHEVLTELAKDDPDVVYLMPVENGLTGVKPQMREEKIKELVMKYLATPCQYYLEQFGPQVFIPAAYGETLLDRSGQYQVKDGDDLTGFMTGWIRYRICDILNRRDITQLANKVTRAGLRKAEKLKKAKN